MANCPRPRIISNYKMKFNWIVENHESINLVWFNWHMASSLR